MVQKFFAYYFFNINSWRIINAYEGIRLREEGLISTTDVNARQLFDSHNEKYCEAVRPRKNQKTPSFATTNA